MSESWQIPEPPDDLTRISDKDGTIHTRGTTGRWFTLGNESGRGNMWPDVLRFCGPVTRAPEPPIVIPAERWDENAVADVIYAAMQAGISSHNDVAKAVLTYLKDG